MDTTSQAAPGATAATLGRYPAASHRYDELLDGSGAIRPHWTALMEHLGTGTEAADRALALTHRLIADGGITYIAPADPRGAARPWALDPLPLVIPAAEWRQIERGVAQRARLLEALLADLYGPQRLLEDGLVPAELAYGHPNFLWPAHGIEVAGGTRLRLYAADLARAPDGRWWLLADRTQTPSGVGYALVNREISAQVLPAPLRDLPVRALGEFVQALQHTLLGGAAGAGPAVVLSSGPYNETYFEHAYLARQLGMALCQGANLTVRHDSLYRRSAQGLERVQAILRRVDDDYCDPLELRSDSALGVAGLLNVVRAGRVALANALGTGVLESRGWLGFYPALADRLLGEPLELPSVATWWCGEAPALQYVLAHLEELIIAGVFPNQHFAPVAGCTLDPAERAGLSARLRARPYAYVAQEHLALSQVPVLHGAAGARLGPGALSIRVYALAQGDGHLVMPGGLAWVAEDAAIDAVGTQGGGASKDIWVLGA